MTLSEGDNPLPFIRERFGKVDPVVASGFCTIMQEYTDESLVDELQEDSGLKDDITEFFGIIKDTKLPSSAVTSLYSLQAGGMAFRRMSAEWSETGRNDLAALMMDFEKGKILTLGPIVSATVGVGGTHDFGGSEEKMRLIFSTKVLDVEENERLLQADPTGEKLLRRQAQRIRTGRVGVDQYIKPYEARGAIISGVDYAEKLYVALFPLVFEVVGNS